MKQEELKILTRFKQRDAKAFAHIFKLHKTALVYFAEKILGIHEEAEDIVGNSFMKLWEKQANFDSFQAIKSFLYVTTRNACFDFLRHSKRVSALQKGFSYWSEKKEEAILRIMDKAEFLAELDKAIELLPPKCRQIFQLAFYEDFSTNEIAVKLGLSDQTVRNQKSRAFQVIRTMFFKRNWLSPFE